MVSGAFGPTFSTIPKFSWPMMRKSSPGGAAPYSAALISLSVLSTPTRSTLTRTPRPPAISSTEGLGTSPTWIEPGLPGWTAIAFMPRLTRPGAAALQSLDGAGPLAAGRPARRGTAGGRRGGLCRAHARVRRLDAARGADVRLEPRSRRGGRPGSLARRPEGHRQVRGAVVPQDVALPNRREHGQDARGPRSPEHPLLCAGRGRRRGLGRPRPVPGSRGALPGALVCAP